MPEFIKPGFKLRVLNESGIGMATRFFNAETGAELIPTGVNSVAVRIDGKGEIKMELVMRKVPVDLVGTVVGMKMSEDCHCIEVDPAEYDVRIGDAGSGVMGKLKRVYFERRK